MIVFDSSVTMLEAAQAGLGIAIAPPRMFGHLLGTQRISRPFAPEISFGSYWLTHLQSRAETSAMREFAQWLIAELFADEQTRLR